MKCKEMSLRSEKLDEQLSSLIQKASLPKDWAEELNRLALQDHKKSAQSNSAFVEEMKKEIKNIEVKLQRLLDGYLDQVIEQEIYRAEKLKLLFKKKSLEEQISSLLQKQNDWLEPMQEWIKVATTLVEIARDSNLLEKKVIAKEIFGSHVLLGEKTVRPAEGGTPNSFGKTGENQPTHPASFFWGNGGGVRNSVSPARRRGLGRNPRGPRLSFLEKLAVMKLLLRFQLRNQ
ncbi:MAG: hypothetical protein HY093_03360 [Candidatus Liptonbacteria bacterium]|nr:hypothetical protein [Candidatus Liptonbacteria bacterium]